MTILNRLAIIDSGGDIAKRACLEQNPSVLEAAIEAIDFSENDAGKEMKVDRYLMYRVGL